MKVEWSRQALDMFAHTAVWYELNMGERAKHRFIDGILKVVGSLANTPRIGAPFKMEGLTDDVEIRSIVEHKNHRIVYYIKGDTVYIADIWSTRMKH